MVKFNLADIDIYTHEDIWKMVKELMCSTIKEYPPADMDGDEFINMYLCEEYPEYLFGYGKILYDDKLYDFTLVRSIQVIEPTSKHRLLKGTIFDLPSDKEDKNSYEEDFTVYMNPIDEETAFRIFTKKMQ